MSNIVPHPFIPNWQGEVTWSAPEDPPSSFVVFEAGSSGAPFRIEHGRDMMFDDGELVQDYNFIDYFFGDPDNPIRARHYLLDDHISVDLPHLRAEATLEDARTAFPDDVFGYLQRRFNAVHVLSRDGYSALWSAE